MQVSKIHRQLPPGGVLVFLSGQHEVQELVTRLRQSFPDAKKPSLASGTSLKTPVTSSKKQKRDQATEAISVELQTSQPGMEDLGRGPEDGRAEEDEDDGLTGGLDAAESSERPSQPHQVYIPGSKLMFFGGGLYLASAMLSWAARTRSDS